MKKIIAHTLVKNEENYIWFSVMGMVDFVDKIFIWDTGSTDKTLEIIKEIEKEKPGKIYFKEVGEVGPNDFTAVRQQMLDESKCDWIILLDGDEVWWEDTIREVKSIIEANGNSLDSIVNRYTNLIGDIYHFQDQKTGRYSIDGKSGYVTIRAMNRNIPGLKAGRPHGQQGFFDRTDTLIQNMDSKRRFPIDKPVNLHFTNLPRSSRLFDLKVPKRSRKYKYELGKNFPLDFYYPEVFFRSRPDIVPSPWVKRDKYYILRASLETPLKNLKRMLFSSSKSGY